METGVCNLKLRGEPVTVDALALRKVREGKFCLENGEDAAFPVGVNVVWLEFGSGRQVLLPDFTISDLAMDLPLNPARFTIGRQTSLLFQIGFAEPAYVPALGECTAVGLRLEAAGIELETLSPVEYIGHPQDQPVTKAA
jgi:hypothetical protein